MSNYTFQGAVGNNDIFHLILSLLMLGASGLEDCQTFNTPTWYISVLFLLYILFFLIQSKVKKQNQLLIYIIISIIGIALIHNKIHFPLLTEEMGRGYLSFSIGCILSLLYKEYYNEKFKKSILIIVGVINFIIILLVKLFSVSILGDICVVTACIFSPSIVSICVLSNSLDKFFELIHIGYLDSISYSLYLWHCPIYVLCNYLNAKCHLSLDFSLTSCYIGIITLVIIIASVSSYLFEIKIIGRIQRKLKL